MKEGYIQKVLPDPLLRDYIWQYTFVDFPFEHTRQMEFAVMPSSHARMILFLGEPSLHEEKTTWQPVDRYSLTGLVSKPHVFLPTATLRQVMVHFTAWGIQPFIRFPLAEITDTRADLNHVFDSELEKLCAGLNKAATTQEKAGMLNRFFIHQRLKVRQTD
ncbi:MAG: hypothetical protein IPL65_05515 [Lewinellaceae bacterium]|nr:hypothetical protein [Lewinellaceae bacterium]